MRFFNDLALEGLKNLFSRDSFPQNWKFITFFNIFGTYTDTFI